MKLEIITVLDIIITIVNKTNKTFRHEVRVSMKSEQYLNYIKSLGDRRQYNDVLGEVSLMVDFENRYGVDIDECFEDDNKINFFLELSGYNERLFFAINRYMRVINENRDLSSFDNTEIFCPDRFCFIGSRDELVDVLSDMMTREDAETLSWHLYEYQNLIDEEEHIYVKEKLSGYIPNGFAFLKRDLEYNINLKALSLMAIALMLDIKLTMGFASTTLGILGVNGQAIVKVSAEEAEMCLINEAILHKPHIIDKGVFKGTSNECVHNDLNCKYREDGICKITENDIGDVLDELSEKNVFTKIRGQYKYNF